MADYSYVPLRRADIEELRRFRNAQIDVLRQARPILPEQQERWFEEQVVPAQQAERPPQILVSILDPAGRFVGYGGLTNIDWDARRAEVSFLVEPERAADEDIYVADMSAFLDHLARLAFEDLGLNRLFAETYAFRKLHIGILERAGFVPEGRLREHVATDAGPGDSLVHGLLAKEWRAA